MLLSKTNFLIFRECAHNAWVKAHKPDVYRAKPLSAFDLNIIETGNEVDELARGLFLGGVVVERDEFDTTTRLIAERCPIIYQGAFATDRYTIATDILVWNRSAQVYDLYEVKSSTSGEDKKAKDELFTYDLGFQVEVLRELGVPLGRQYIVRLDSEYVRGEQLDLDGLFTREDFTESVAEILSAEREEMVAAYEVMQRPANLPSPCECILKGRSAHCTTFGYSSPGVPEYSVHDIARIGLSKKKLAKLIDDDILAVTDVPDDAELSDTQMNQVRSAKTGREVVRDTEVRDFLDKLEYPLSFFDYETYPAGVPRFEGYRPFDQIPFQFSLDVLDGAASAMQHHEFLFVENQNPDAALISKLRQAFPPRGSIVVWSKKFEIGINEHLAERNAEDADFLLGLNGRVIDLMDVFTSQAFIHPEFRGKTSIKAVLPVLVPGLSYKQLGIQEGGTASDAWNKIVTGQWGGVVEKQKVKELLEYCGRDTRAMYEIWRVLQARVGL